MLPFFALSTYLFSTFLSKPLSGTLLSQVLNMGCSDVSRSEPVIYIK
jgi:hypothetical protein